MTTEKTQTREQQLAHACTLTVMTGWLRCRNGVPDDVLSCANEVFDESHDRYDLLAARRLDLQLKSSAFRELIIGDVIVAIGLHGAERLLVRTDKSARPEVEELKFGDDFPCRLRLALSLQPIIPPPERLPVVVTCMDWRLHRADSFAKLVSRQLGYGDFYLMTVPGVAKELTRVGPRVEQVVMQIEDYLESLGGGEISVDLVSHTDCGKYGGSEAFAGPQHEYFELRFDLACAARLLSERLPDVSVGTHIAQLKEDVPVALV